MLKWPDICSFTMKPSKKKQKWKNGKETGNQLYDFVYIESFLEIDEKLLERTVAMMEPLKAQTALNIRRHGKKGFKISGVATREEVASMIVGEFFVHSAIGRMKLGELWEAATVGMLYNAKIQHEDQAAKAT